MTSLPGTAFILQLYSALKVPVYALLEVHMLRCVHSGTLSPKLENKQPNFLRSKYYVKNAHVEPFLGSERVSPHKVLLIPVSLVFSQTPLYPNNISTRN